MDSKTSPQIDIENNTIQELLAPSASINPNNLFLLENNPITKSINGVNNYTTSNQAFCKDDIKNEQINLSSLQNVEEDESENDTEEDKYESDADRDKYEKKIIEILKSDNIYQIDLTNYVIISKIYSNDKTNVFLIKHKDTKCLYVAKELFRYKYKDFIRELTILSKLDHPFIVKAIGYSLRNIKQEPSKFIIMDFIKNGSLKRFLSEERSQIANEIWNNTRKLILIYGIAAAILYLHSKKILHLDIKSENVLINEYIFPILCDFGYSMFKDCSIHDQPPFGGTPPYCSPEVFEGKRTEKCDSFSFGFLVYVILTEQISLYHSDLTCFQYELLNNKFKWPKLDKSIPEFYRFLIKKCWELDPKERWAFTEIIEYIKNFNDFNEIGVDDNLLRSFIKFVESQENGTDSTFKLDERFQKLDELYKSQKKECQSSSSFLSCFSTNEEEEDGDD